MTTPQKVQKRTLTGTVTSAKMAKTVVVRVDRLKLHPKYKQRYRVSKKYKAHNEDTVLGVGDTVVIEETRPMSRDKRWKVISKMETVKKRSADTAVAEAPEEDAAVEQNS